LDLLENIATNWWAWRALRGLQASTYTGG